MEIDYENNICLKDVNFDNLKSKKIIIYGAGVYGTLLFSFLDLKGLKNNIICFAVTDKKGNPQKNIEMPVVQFEDIEADFRDVTILIAVKKNIDSIIEKIKQKQIYNYYWLTSGYVKEIGKEFFRIYRNIPIQKGKIFFYCYEGMGYRCNCKYIAEKLLEENYPFQLVWAISSWEDASDIPNNIKVVKINTKEYFEELYTSCVVVENDGRDLLTHKRKGQFCINTWHGYGPFKKVNGALPGCNSNAISEYYSYYDLFLTASKFYTQIYRKSFGYKGEVLECGAPRNDIFFKSNHAKEKIYHLYNIPSEKGIVLFAPTFRNDKVGAFGEYRIDMGQVLDTIEKKFQKEYIFLYRFHHQLYKIRDQVENYAKGIDVTLYPDIQELLVAADIVITDYSSLMWDFSLQKKPVFLYQKDFEKYEDERGFYAPVSEWPYPRAYTQEELIKEIEKFDQEKYIEELEMFLDKYGSCDDGHAAESIVKRILLKMEEQEFNGNYSP